MTTGELSRYPRPNVAVDVALFTVAPAGLLTDDDVLGIVVLRGSDSIPALPGRFIRPGRTVDQTVEEVVTRKLGLSPARVHPALLHVFSDPDRDPRGWTLSLAHSLALPWSQVADVADKIEAVSPDGRLASSERLAYDHDRILERALARLRERYEAGPDPDRLLEPPFTLSQLRRLHERVLGEPLRRDTFNRRMGDSLREAKDRTGATLVRSETVGRPAKMFTFPASAPPAAPAFPYPLPRATDSGSTPSPSRRRP